MHVEEKTDRLRELTPSDVKHHLTSIFAKLNLTSRRQPAVVLRGIRS
jgi:DNA-binding CsgD family transcriptional regulator